MKAIKELETKVTEINEAKDRLAKLETSYDKSNMTVAEKQREIKALEAKVKTLEKELLLGKTLAEIKKIIWAKIGQSIQDQCRSIQAIYEQVELISMAHMEIQRARTALGIMPEQANKMIHFLNNRTREELAALEINSRTETILIAKKVLTLRNFTQTLERKCQEMKAKIDEFRAKMTVLQDKGLPSLVTGTGQLLSYNQYMTRIKNYVENQITASSSSTEEAGPPSGQSMYD